jgi:hypothetical protein
MSDEPNSYQTYLLRLWRARCQGSWQWRASLESPSTGERHTFGTLDALSNYLDAQLTFLEHQTDTEPQAPPPARESEEPALPDEPSIRPA